MSKAPILFTYEGQVYRSEPILDNGRNTRTGIYRPRLPEGERFVVPYLIETLTGLERKEFIIKG